MSYPRGLLSIVQQIREGYITRIGVLTGAGISTASGIPDFRSPGGLYSTLRPELLTASPQEKDFLRREPTGVVDIRLFSRNQFPYLEVRRPFILGTAEKTWKATAAHAFFALLHRKSLLRRHYDQNIDGLSHQLGIPKSLVINVHGTLSEVCCEKCGSEHPASDFREQVREKIKDIYNVDPDAPKESENILCRTCGAPALKPATVLFGRNLPQEFHDCVREDFEPTDGLGIDLLIVAGTSLTVHPAAGLVSRLPAKTPRILINLDKVGEELGLELEDKDGQSRDVFLQGSCDDGCLLLAELLGWKKELADIFGEELCDSSRNLLGLPARQ